MEIFKNNLLFTIILLTLITWPWPQALGDEKEQAAILDRILKDYDKRFRPNFGKNLRTSYAWSIRNDFTIVDSPRRWDLSIPHVIQCDGEERVEVGVTMYVLSAPEIDSVAQTITLNIYFRQYWTDPRLAFGGNGNGSIVLDGFHWDKLWVPDTFFVNEVSSTLHDTTVPNVFTRISPSGEVLNSGRYTLQFALPMDTQYFPFDEQLCSIEVESYGFTMRDISYKWAKGNKSFGMSVDLFNPEFKFVGHRVRSFEMSLSSGNYSRLLAEISIARVGGRYVVEFFLPAIILTVLSLTSLLVAEARSAIFINAVTLAVTVVFLTVSTGLMEVPKFGTLTSMDTFSGITYAYIILCLWISTLSFYLSKRNKRAESIELRNMDMSRRESERRFSQDDEANLCPRPSSGVGGGRHPVTPPSKFWTIRKNIEGIIFRLLPTFKILLVISYALANIIYWAVHPSSGYMQKQSREALVQDDWNLL